ncbi:GtrA family protein [Dactylosporangium sp. NPDC049742]|uniref:GtrA family protein n=1 Tax=Dactylosporangium sp. NPDC049742 TaxID=3154737 RepID=UPI003420A642
MTETMDGGPALPESLNLAARGNTAPPVPDARDARLPEALDLGSRPGAPPAEPAPSHHSWLVRTAITLYNDRRVRYLGVGGVSAVAYYGSFAAVYLLTRDHWHYLVPTIIANFICALCTYPLQRHFVFQSKGPIISGFLKFYVICLWALAFTMLGLPLLVEVFNVPVLISQAILIVVAPLINYQLSKLWAFRR